MISPASRNVPARGTGAAGGGRSALARLPRLERADLPGLAVTLVGSVVLVGWLLDVEHLKSVVPTLVSMKPNTAVSLVLGGLALMFLRMRRHVWLGRTAAVLVVVIGALTLAEWAFAWDFGIDELLFDDSDAALGTPGRMSPASAACFLLAGGALLALDVEIGRRRRVRPAEVGALAVAAIALTVLTGYVFGAHPFRGVGAVTPMAVHTATALLVLAAGILLARPRQGAMRVVTSRSSSGVLARRLLAAAILGSFAIALVRYQGERAELYGHQAGIAGMVVTLVVLSTALVWVTARSLERSDEQRRAYAERLETIARIQSAILGARSAAEIAATAVAELRPRLGASRVSLLRFDPTSEELEVVAFDEERPSGIGLGWQMRAADTPRIEQLTAGETVVLDDVASTLREEHVRRAAEATGVRSIAMAPLRQEG
jgi:hypothetical protein